jgi:hypothetical protein
MGVISLRGRCGVAVLCGPTSHVSEAMDGAPGFLRPTHRRSAMDGAPLPLWPDFPCLRGETWGTRFVAGYL